MELERLYTKRNRISVEIKNDNYIAGHFHQELELIFVMQGTVTVMADSGVSHLQKEDIRVINPNCSIGKQFVCADYIFLCVDCRYIYKNVFSRRCI